MKNAKTKSVLVILATLLIGMLLGGLIAGHLIRGRVHDFMDMRGGKGFQQGVLSAAHPTPDQEAAILPILEAFSARLDSMHSRHIVELKENMTLLEMGLEAHLDAQQMEAVRKKLRRMEGHGHGKGHGRGHGGHHTRKFHFGHGDGE
jgi:hypothetical protein